MVSVTSARTGGLSFRDVRGNGDCRAAHLASEFESLGWRELRGDSVHGQEQLHCQISRHRDLDRKRLCSLLHLISGNGGPGQEWQLFRPTASQLLLSRPVPESAIIPAKAQPPNRWSGNSLGASRESLVASRCSTIVSAHARTLLQKVWDAHTVRKLPNGQTQLFIGLHLIHEVTTPQAFDMLRARGWRVRFPERTIATVDHIVPTRDQRAAIPRRDGRGHVRRRSSGIAASAASGCSTCAAARRGSST